MIKVYGEIDMVVPWHARIELIVAYYRETSKKGGRYSCYPLAILLSILLLQSCHPLSNPTMEEALIEVPTMRLFVGIDLIRDRKPD